IRQSIPDSTAPTHRGFHHRQPQPHGQLRTRRNLETHFIHPPIPHTTQTRPHRNRPQKLQRHPGFSPQSRLPHWGSPHFSQHPRLHPRRPPPQKLQRHPGFSPQSRLPHWGSPHVSQHRRLQRRRFTRCSCG